MTRLLSLCVLMLLLAVAAPGYAAYSLVQTLHQPATGSGFGASIAVQGDEAVIANLSMNTEAAYVFRRQGGQWVKTQTLTLDLPAQSGTLISGYPTMVAINGDTLVLGAPFANFGGMNARGAVYIYIRSGNTWVLQQRLVGVDGPANAGNYPPLFGHAVAVEGDTLVIGAPGRSRGEPYTSGSGAAFVYTRSGNTWTLRKTLLSPANDIQGAFFANDLDLEGNRIIIGEWRNNRAYLYSGAGDNWMLETTLAPGDGDVLGDGFGMSVDIDAGRIAVGASNAETNGQIDGAVYLYLNDGDSWGQFQRVVPSGPAASSFGHALHLSGKRLLVGDPDGGVNGIGQAEVFTTGNLFFSHAATLYQSFQFGYHKLGSALVLTPQGALVGDMTRSAPDATGDEGLAYLFEPPSPELELSTTEIAFGDVAVGGNALKSANLKNVGDATLHVTQIESAIAPFSRQGGSCGNLLPIVLEPNASCTINYRFAPNGVGAFGDQLGIASDDPAGDQSLALQGNGVAPQLSLLPSLLNVGTAVLGDTTSPAELELRNDGGATLTVSSIAMAQAPFALASTTCAALPFNLAPGASCILRYTFNAISAGEFNQPLNVLSNSATSPDQIVLYGYGDGPGLSLSPNPADFGGVAVGASADLAVVLFSSGVTDLTINAVPEPDAPFTRIASDCPALPFVLPPDTSCTVTYRFLPTESGTAQYGLVVESDATVPLTPLTLVGDGLQPALTMAPAQLDFGAKLPGDQQDLSTKLSNIGGLDLEIQELTAANAPFAVIGGSCPLPPFTLAPSASCTLSMRFSPVGTGLFEDVMVITDNAPGAPHALTLRGEGADPMLLLSPSSIDFGHVSPGNSSFEVAVAVHSSGGTKVTVDVVDAIPAPFVLVSSDCPPPPFSIIGAEGCTLRLRFDPVALGSFDSTVALISDANNSPTSLQLHGVGGEPEPMVFSDGFEQ